MTAENDRRAAGPRGVVRALGALLALGILVGAVPVALVALMGALPLDLGALAPAAWARADDGRLLLLVIVAVAWAAWVLMVLSVGLETWAALRRVPTPALPGLGAPQRWAAILVTSVLVGMSPAAAAPTPAAAPVSLSAAVGMSAAVASAALDRVESEDRRKSTGAVLESVLPTGSDTPANPTMSTERHDTLWMLAEQYLGAGERFGEIVELNRGVQQPDGRSLDDDGRIYPGWTLALPVDAVIGGERPERHRVVPGDTLWQIADDELGDGSRYLEIAEVNRGDLQPDGRWLADPDLILPGWILEIPDGEREGAGHVAPIAPDVEADALSVTPDWTADGPAPTADETAVTADETAVTADETAVTADETAVPPDESADASGQGAVASPGAIPPIERARSSSTASSTASSASTPGDISSPAAAGSDADQPILDRGVPTMEHDRTPSVAAPADDAAPADGPGPTPAAAIGGAAIALPAGGAVAALLLAGVGAELVRRRRQFQRHRRPGERMPSPGPGARQVERAARIATGESGPSLFERALVQLAEESHVAGRRLPDVRLVRVSEASVVLDLAAPAGPAIAPFVAADDTRWVLAPGLLPAKMPDRSRALPGLVTLGFAGSDTLLLNLASVGTLAVCGPDAATADVLRGLAAELAFGPASGVTERTLCLADPAIAEAVEAGGIAVESEPTRVAAALTAVLAQPESADAAADDPLLIVLCDRPLGIAVPRGSRCALITAAPEEGAGATVVVHADGMSVLLPERESLTAQRLSPAATSDVIEALCASDLPEAVASRSHAPVDAALDGAADGQGRSDGTRDPQVTQTAQTSLWDCEVPASEVIDLREIPSDPDRPDPRILQHVADLLEPDDDTVPVPAPVPVDEGLNDAVPRVLLLGEVLVENAHGKAESTRLGRLAETTAFVLLNQGSRPSELQGALWPGRRSNPQTCRQMISRARTWLGRTDAGEPYLMTFAESAGRLRLRDEVSSDWADFQRLAGIGLADPEDTEHLTQALALVRGRPFGAVASRELPWADLHINEMISLITDVAHALALRHEEAGRRSAARDAALRGLRTESESEVLEEIVARALA